MAKTTLLIATSNAGKVREMQASLQEFSIEVKNLCDMPKADCPVEDADTFLGNARLKALHYGQLHDGWTLADDSGLAVDALGGAPGIHSARFAGNEANDNDNNEKLLHELAGIPAEARTAHFVCALVLVHQDRILAEVEGRVDGVVLTESRGENGFGYDPLFYIHELGMTTAEMSAEQKNEVSHRGQAVCAMKEKMKAILMGA